MTRTIAVGVLALQGAFLEHLLLLRQAIQGTELGERATWNFFEVRTAEELSACDALIIPGGESTTMALVAERSGLLEPLRHFVK
jgi:5'-phosphate synthase pdxT subunit